MVDYSRSDHIQRALKILDRLHNEQHALSHLAAWTLKVASRCEEHWALACKIELKISKLCLHRPAGDQEQAGLQVKGQGGEEAVGRG